MVANRKIGFPTKRGSADAVLANWSPKLAEMREDIDEMASTLINQLSGLLPKVDPTHLAARTSMRPLEHATGGHYHVGNNTGTLATTSVAGTGALWSLRWTHATKLCVVTEVYAEMIPLSVFTTPGREIGMAAWKAYGFTASDSGGNTVTLSDNNKLRSSMPDTVIASGDVRIATTVTLTTGTRTISQAFAACIGVAGDINSAAGTAQILGRIPVLHWKADVDKGEYPIVLEQNEGIIVTNTVAFQAAGSARATIRVAWAEVDSY